MRDTSEPGIVRALTAFGCSVQPLSGKDVPDLLVGVKGVNILLECKAAAGPRGGTNHRNLTPGQEKWHRTWRGGRVWVARNADDAIAAVLEALEDAA
jgi:hypothetical protein